MSAQKRIVRWQSACMWGCDVLQAVHGSFAMQFRVILVGFRLIGIRPGQAWRQHLSVTRCMISSA